MGTAESPCRPSRRQREPVDTRTDLFSFRALIAIYEMTTSRSPPVPGTGRPGRDAGRSASRDSRRTLRQQAGHSRRIGPNRFKGSSRRIAICGPHRTQLNCSLIWFSCSATSGAAQKPVSKMSRRAHWLRAAPHAIAVGLIVIAGLWWRAPPRTQLSSPHVSSLQTEVHARRCRRRPGFSESNEGRSSVAPHRIVRNAFDGARRGRRAPSHSWRICSAHAHRFITYRVESF